MRWPASLLLWQIMLNSLLRDGRASLLPCGGYRRLAPSNETRLCSDESSAVSTGARMSRRKRSLTFPKGSAFVLTMAIVKAIQLKVPANWNLDLEFDMIWPIPKGQEANVPHWRRPWFPHRRHRRELYSNFEMALESQGLPGKECILRTICETKLVLNPPGISLVEDLIRVIFSYPAAGELRPDDYDAARMTEGDCAVEYPSCPISFLYLLLHSSDE